MAIEGGGIYIQQELPGKISYTDLSAIEDFVLLNFPIPHQYNATSNPGYMGSIPHQYECIPSFELAIPQIKLDVDTMNPLSIAKKA